MPIFVTDISAFRLWFCDQPVIRIPRPLTHAPEFLDATARAADLPHKQLASLGISGQIHLAVPPGYPRNSAHAIAVHVLTRPVPGTFTRLTRDVYATSPITTLTCVANRLPAGTLAVLLNQLLGTYGIRNGRLVERKPLATRAELQRHIDVATGSHGVRAVRNLLPYVLENTASPAEAQAAALLFLPPRLGGRGLPLAQANFPIEVMNTGGGSTAMRYADFCWKDKRVVLEYDSDEYHAGVAKLSQDSARRAQLQAAGYTVITLTNHQLHDAAEFEHVVSTLRRLLRRRSKTAGVDGFAVKEAELRAAIRQDPLPILGA